MCNIKIIFVFRHELVHNLDTVATRMVYIAPDGRVLQAKPWGLHTITDFFWGIIAFFQLFFRTLIDPNANKKGEGYSTDYRNTGGRGGPPGKSGK